MVAISSLGFPCFWVRCPAYRLCCAMLPTDYMNQAMDSHFLCIIGAVTDDAVANGTPYAIVV